MLGLHPQWRNTSRHMAGRQEADRHPRDLFGWLSELAELAAEANAAIEVFRKVDFVWGANPFFDPSRQYCDIVLPIATWWEKGNLAWMNNSDTVYWADRIMEPLFESKPESYVAEELAKRLNVDPAALTRCPMQSVRTRLSQVPCT